MEPEDPRLLRPGGRGSDGEAAGGARKALDAMKDHVRRITRRSGGRGLRGSSKNSGVAAWLAQLLQPRGDPRRLRRPGQVDPPPAACPPAEAVEARRDGLPRTGARGASEDVAAPVAANFRRGWRNASMRFIACWLRRISMRSGFRVSGYLNFTNRPVRTRMPGGVAGVTRPLYADRFSPREQPASEWPPRQCRVDAEVDTALASRP